MTSHIAYYDSPLGRILLSEEEGRLTGLWFEGQKYYGSNLDNESIEEDTDVLEEAKSWLDIYFAGKIPDFELPLKFKGTDFQIKVWEALLKVEYGQRISYKQLGEMIYGDENFSCRAIGMAVGHNPISLIVPCHRIIGSDGSLKGYAGGLERKEYLLKMEEEVLRR
ncbi:MAG: methylated-DNA--[Erysipelotrichaceae bacterium]|nr:methylated-DNA--[protein]-cysteine S-methyltransferase [Erysipelotrichaceae bacterium]